MSELYDIIAKANEFSKDFEIGVQPDKDGLLKKAVEFLKEEVNETEEAINNQDRPEIIDGFGDVAFIALNGIYKEFRAEGDDHLTASKRVHEVMKRICEANLGKKHPDGTIQYNNGKVQKPNGWKPPQYDDLVA